MKAVSISLILVAALVFAAPAEARFTLGLNSKYHVTGHYRATLTAYSTGGCDSSSGGPFTSLGTRVRPGVLAILPGTIPLGTRVFFKSPLPGRASRYYRIEDHIGWTPFGRYSLDVAVTCQTLRYWRNPTVDYWTFR